MTKLTPEAWTDYWKSGDITTFGYGFSGGYDGSIRDFWYEQVNGERGPIIDLCCGNGALVWLVDGIFSQDKKKPEIVGVDLADIRPFEKLKKNKRSSPNIRFIANTSVENLPFEGASIGLAVSQYGLEYANFDTAVAELSRVLKSRSRIVLIMHSNRSSVLAWMTEFFTDFSYLFNEVKLDEVFLELDSLCNRVRNQNDLRDNPEYKKLIGKINQHIYPITKSHMNTFSDIRERPDTIVSQRFINRLFLPFRKWPGNNHARRKELQAQISNIKGTLERVADLKAAAVSDERMQELQGILEKYKFKVSLVDDIFYNERENYGWKIVAERG